MIARKKISYPLISLLTLIISCLSLACTFVVQKDVPNTSIVQEAITQQGGISKDSFLQELVNRYVENHDFDGVISIYSKGKLVFDFAGGNHSEGFNKNTPFPIGSISKIFTAEIIQQVLSKYNKDYSSDLSMIIPGFKSKKSIQIKDLLTHSSGIPDYYNLDEFENIRDQEITTSVFAEWVQQFSLEFDPGSQNAYSNSGYNLLAYVAETLCQCSYSELLEATFIKPLGLHSIQSLDQMNSGKKPKGYSPGPAPEFFREPSSIHPGWLIGSGSILASSHDLIQLSKVIMKRVKENPDWKPYGWGVRQRNSQLFLEQNGRISGYASHFRVFPSDDVSIVVLSRIESEAVNALAVDLTEYVFGEQVEIPEERNYMDVELSALKEYEGVYKFSPNFFVTVFQSVDGLEIATGKNQKGNASYLDPIGKDEFFFRVGNTSIQFGRDQSGKVNGLYWGGSGLYPLIHE